MSQSLREEIKQGLIWNDVYLNEVMERTISVIENRIESKLHDLEFKLYELEDNGEEEDKIKVIANKYEMCKEIKELLK